MNYGLRESKEDMKKKMITTNIIVGEINMMRCDYDYDYDDDYYRISHGRDGEGVFRRSI